MTNLCLKAGCPGLCCLEMVIKMTKDEFYHFTAGIIPPDKVTLDQLKDSQSAVAYARVPGNTRKVNLNGYCPHYDHGCNIYLNRPVQCQEFTFNGDVCLQLRSK